jgi:hypothetical protein
MGRTMLRQPVVPKTGPRLISVQNFKPPGQINGSVLLRTDQRSRGWGVVPIAQTERIHVTW